jgi:hypothetical protein
MFVISIEQKATDGSTKTGRLNLIDLAGSEKISKTGATGDTLEEVSSFAMFVLFFAQGNALIS